jgi:hypothetical protein
MSPPVDLPTPRSWPAAGAWQGEHRYPGCRDGATVTVDGCARSAVSQVSLAVGAGEGGVTDAGVREGADDTGVTGTEPQPVTMTTNTTATTNECRLATSTPQSPC